MYQVSNTGTIHTVNLLHFKNRQNYTQLNRVRNFPVAVNTTLLYWIWAQGRQYLTLSKTETFTGKKWLDNLKLIKIFHSPCGPICSQGWKSYWRRSYRNHAEKFLTERSSSPLQPARFRDARIFSGHPVLRRDPHRESASFDLTTGSGSAPARPLCGSRKS